MAEFNGSWNIEINTPMGKQEGVLVLNQSGGDLSGSMAQGGDSTDIENGSVADDQASWDVKVSKPMPLTLGFTAHLDGDNIGGKVKLGAFGEADFSGTPA
ncbi:hypothetical protein [Parvularcula sp. IMCC14364]|uniref:hypothetical protein n=1 Tax=Parvularcula sp. IMCC14364 TaxID=3067902 RepID=UPI0027409982|nr:hypothetical protein [Parvularcula sp. IMCC14364]